MSDARQIVLRERVPPARSTAPGGILAGAETLTGALAALVQHCPEFECLVLLEHGRDERRLTVGELWRRAEGVHAALAERGVRPGDVVVIVLPTGPDLVAGYCGALLAGGVPALLATPSNRVAEEQVYAERVARILRNARARVVYCAEEVAGRLAPLAAALGGTQVLTPPAATGARRPPVLGTGDALATVQYSSGSTGDPKGILLSHRAMLNNIRSVREVFGLTVADVSVNWIPLYHDMGLIDAFLVPLLGGCPTVLIPTMDFLRDPALWLWAIHHYGGTLSYAPNFAYALCAKRVRDGEIAGLDLSTWRIAANGAEPVLAPTLEAFAARYAGHGFRAEAFTPIWGMAENVTVATCHPVGTRFVVDRVDRGALARDGVAQPTAGDGADFVSVGRPVPRSAVEIRDEAGRPLPNRRVGTIWLRSDSLCTGYHGEPEETARRLIDGWLDTGDRGYLADGTLYFVARDKDLVVVGGEKYAPQDIEAVINRIPGVREGCAVVLGVLNAERGTEELAAVVETRGVDAAGEPALREAIQVAVARATGLGLRFLLLVPPGGVEKTTSGKLARRATRARYGDRLR